MTTPLTTPRLAAAGAAAALLLAGCGAGDDPMDTSGGDGGGNGGGESGPVVIGSANFPESELLAEIYTQALSDEGIEVDTQLGIGTRETYLQALEDGSIDLIPEYTGNLLAYYDEETTATESTEVYDELAAALPDGFTALEMSEAESKDAVVVTSETADELSLTTIADLQPHAGDLILGGPPEWRDRPTGIPGLRDVYGLEFESFAPADSTQNASALASGRIDVANIFTTDPSIIENDFVVLEDPENLFPAQNVVPLINEAKATDEVQAVLNDVSADLDTDTLAELDKRVISDNEDASAVAESWLEAR